MDIIVIGGGASGLVAAITAARNGNIVTILEKNNKCGKKILVTGNGKCNYYNSDQSLNHYHSFNNGLISTIINEKTNKLVLNFFSSIGVIPRIKDGYYYPYSNRADSILNSLKSEANRLGINFICDVRVNDILKNSNGFTIETDRGKYYGSKVVIATGSNAYYKDDVNTYSLLEKLGHKIIAPLPALVQVISTDSILKKLVGVKLGAKLKLYEDSKFIKEESGELLFASYGLSGICTMQLSSFIARGLYNNRREVISINFIPELANNVDDCLKFFNDYSNNLEVGVMLDNIINYKLGNAIIDKLKIDGNKPYKELNNKEKYSLADNIINFKLDIIDTKSFKESQTVSGGVPIDSINPKTMESLVVDDLYIVGEVLDVNGDCGGYNLTFAWTSGIIAGMSLVKEKIK